MPSRSEAAARCSELVDELRADGRLRSPAVENALRAVPRHAFAPAGTTLEDAYADRVIVLADGEDGQPSSTISQPTMVACMLEQLAPRIGQRVLEIGTASGYNAALLARLVGGRGRVVTVELDPELAHGALERLRRLSVRADVLAGDGWLGAPDDGPFDRIVATVGVWDLSPAWRDQLRDGGVLVAPLWLGPGVELSVGFRRVGDELRSESVHPCGFLRLRGPHAAPDGHRPLPLGTARVVVGELLTGEAVAPLGELLRSRPSQAERAPRLAEGWSARLALDDPHTIRVATTSDPPRAWCGIFCADGPGAALVVGKRLLGFGDPAVLERLRERLAAADRPLAIERLTVRAVPAGADGPPPRWLIRRPAFDFHVDEGASP